MRVFVSGRTGFVRRHIVRCLEARGCVLDVRLSESTDSVIHLAWAGLPNYESEDHYGNIPWQEEWMRQISELGISNVTITGTCLETVANPPAYACAKLVLRMRVEKLLPKLKWVRLWYLHGEGQREECLLPSLRRAIAEGAESFQVIDGARDFMDVNVAAAHICDIAMQTEVTGVIDCCTGLAEPVIDFCRRHCGVSDIRLETGYPRPAYEPESFCGDPTKLNSIR